MRYRSTNRYDDVGDGVTHLILKCGAVYKIDSSDRALVESFTWHKNDERYGYAKTNVRIEGSKKYRRVSLHSMLCPTTADRPLVDHESGDVFDNRRANLRPCSRSQNNMNKKCYRNSKTAVKGVFFRSDKGRFEATIGYGRKQHYVGSFSNLDDAAVAIRSFRERAHGEFARHA